MNLGFETIGNAILVCYDGAPILVTDPWITGGAYFGSWGLSHQIPSQVMDGITRAEYVWISHGHPDHLSFRSLDGLAGKKILLPDHVGGLIAAGLRERALPAAGRFAAISARRGKLSPSAPSTPLSARLSTLAGAALSSRLVS
jgi:L-ascorbate metabolism protein UlaG (beta-lactamase superfamily)